MYARPLLIVALVAGCAPSLTPEKPPEPRAPITAEVPPEEVLRVAGHDDGAFVREAVSATTFVREASAYAMRLGTTSAVDTLAQELIDDQHEINTQLTALARTKGISTPDAMLPDHAKRYDELVRAPGLIDDPYLDIVRSAVEEEILLFDRCAKLCEDRDLQIFAGTALLMIRDHLEEIESRLPTVPR
jgi:predicted outer membrane protein